MSDYPFTVEYYENGWRFECGCETLEDAIDEAKEFNYRTDGCTRVVDESGNEHFRTEGKSDYTNR